MARAKQETSTKKQVAAPAPVQHKINYLLLLGIAFITLAVYWPSLQNQLTNWDDQEYITFNKDLSESTITRHFSERPQVMGNYHPLTMLTLSWDYASAFDESTGTIDPVPFHRTSLFLHALNALLVYLLIFKLRKSNTVAAFTAAVFALHPLHVESVAWASERKDVLYAFFYLGAALAWTYFMDSKSKIVSYIVTFLLFVLALFSKAVAVTLPLLLLAMDYYRGRKFSWKMLAEKIPFFILSVWFGYMAIQAQKEFESLSANETYSLGERALFASYGTMQYVLKFFAPVNLSCFYPYPSPAFPKSSLYYIAPVVVLGLLLVLFRFRRNREVMFGALFFFITVALVLQFMSVGGAVMADRYTYLPYIGLAFIVGTLIDAVIRKKLVQKPMAVFVPVSFVLLMTIFAYQRTQVWADSVTLWTDAESKEKLSPKIYSNFGDACTLAGDYGKAVELLNRAVELKSDYPDAYYNRGLALFYQKRYDAAIADYSKAIQYNPQLKQAWYNRAGTYFTIGKFKEAQQDALKAQALGYPVDPQFLIALEQALAAKPQ